MFLLNFSLMSCSIFLASLNYSPSFSCMLLYFLRIIILKFLRQLLDFIQIRIIFFENCVSLEVSYILASSSFQLSLCWCLHIWCNSYFFIHWISFIRKDLSFEWNVGYQRNSCFDFGSSWTQKCKLWVIYLAMLVVNRKPTVA